MTIDYTAIITAIVTGVLSIGGVAVFMAKYMPKLSGWISLAKDGVETINDISQALQPDTNGKVELTVEEITQINKDATNFKTQLAILLGK